MFSWLFKKSGFGSLVVPGSAAAKAAEKAAKSSPAQTTAAQAAKAASAAAAAQTKAAAKAEAEARRAREQQDADAEWQPRLQAALAQAALGDPSALLQVALAAPVLEIKRSAVEALSDEPSLRQVEREFRRHDRRVHQIAKRRLEAAVLLRETQASADSLLAQAESWRGLAALPVNHLVTLDRDWQALDAVSIAPAQRERFEPLRAALDAQVRAHAQHQQDAQRRNAQASQTLAALRLACGAALEAGLDGTSAEAPGAAEAIAAGAGVPTALTALTALRQTAESLAAQEAEAQAQLPAPAPADPAAPPPVLSKQAVAHQALMQALAQAAQQAQAVEARLGWLAALPVAVVLAPQPVGASAAVATPEAADAPAPAAGDPPPSAVAP